ncbi:hypothetical protein L804_04636 [Cryptococcus deuterogattii 2001/935-1]|nr:hypothetical protein L804_04636 [Cryptococcus deuterogattii 2001/935-1]
MGAFMPLVTHFLTADTFISSVMYFVKIKSNISALLNPPDPSPTVLMLPSSSKPMQHIRQTNGGSFFALQQPTVMSDTGYTANLHDEYAAYGYAEEGMGEKALFDADAPPLPPAEPLDPETIRWLSAYPTDPELTSLISSLRANKLNDDFLLSSVGLLYLRPEKDEEQALLVPPVGVIRKELIEDAHLEPSPYSEQVPVGDLAHNNIEIMVVSLGDTFWWDGLARDCQECFEKCQVCKVRKRKDEIEAQAGMTTLP